jgi:hypothetical protein
VNILLVDIDLIEYYIKCRNVSGNLDKNIVFGAGGGKTG